MTGLAVTALAVLAIAVAGMRAGVEPFATWFYPFAWYSTLLVIESAVAHRDGRFFLLDRPAFAVSLLGWSIPFWLFFELLNFRLANWYYVFVPDGAVARWTGIALSFATVLPAIFVAERVLGAYGPWRETALPAGPIGRERPGRLATEGGRRFDWTVLVALQALGAACLLLPLVWPRLFFPLVWVGVTLVADPWVYRRDPGRSLLADLEAGRPRRLVRLLVGGMAIGLLWELYNVGARGKWIYTVPFFEELKLFEMPLLGFFGFPFLALEGWSVYQALVVAGLAVDPRRGSLPRRRAARTGWAVGIGALAALFSALVLRGMEVETVSSRTLRVEALGDPAAQALRTAGYDVFALADAEPAGLAASTGLDLDRAAGWVEWARLATLRGIGAEQAARLRAAGVASVPALAAVSPEALAARLAETGTPVPPARVRVWVSGARDALHDGNRRP